MASVVDKDYLGRQIKQLAELLARLLSLGKAGKQDEAEESLAAGARELLGFEYRTLLVVDSRSAAELLGTKTKIEAFIGLLEAEAELAETLGDLARAASRRAHAEEMRALAAKRSEAK